MTFEVGGIKMNYPIMLGGGVCKKPKEVLEYMREDLPIGAVEPGSFTPDDRPGNGGVMAWPHGYQEFLEAGLGLNSFGMPNDAIGRARAELIAQREQYTCLVIPNFAGFSAQDYAYGAGTFGQDPDIFPAIVANLGCPNAHDGATSPISLDLDAKRRIFDAIGKVDPLVPVWVKESLPMTVEMLETLKKLLPQVDFSNTPMVNEEHVYHNAELLRSYPFIRAVIHSNTVGNCILLGPDGRPVTTPNGGKAGLSGPVLKGLNIKFNRFMRSLLPNTISIIHSGGVLSGDDVVDCLEQGCADVVQCTSGPYWYGDGPRFFANLLQSERLQDYLAARMGFTIPPKVFGSWEPFC